MLQCFKYTDAKAKRLFMTLNNKTITTKFTLIIFTKKYFKIKDCLKKNKF